MTEISDISAKIVNIFPLLLRKVHYYMHCHSENIVSAHFRLLQVLNKKSRTMSELAEIQSVSMATMSNTVALLVEKGWVIRVPSPDDRRIIRVEITDLGKEKLTEVDRHLGLSIDKLLNDLSEEELNQVGQGLDILHKLLLKDLRQDQSHPSHSK